MRWLLAALAVAGAVALAACSAIPADPDGTLSRVTGGELRVGASPAEGLLVVEGADVSGPLVELVEGFAAEHRARAVWSVGSEEELVRGIEDGSLDLVVGGMSDATLWTPRVAVTRGYPGLGTPAHPLVMFARLGENGFLNALETYLDRASAQRPPDEGGP